MESKRAQDYVDRMKINASIMKQQLDGLTDADLLQQPDMRGNCANWVLGHIVQSRNNMLKLLGQTPPWGESEKAMYEYNTPPITSADSPHLGKDTLLSAYEDTGATIMQVLDGISDDWLDSAYNERSTNAEMLNFQIWHESYHTGQFEYLRQLSGVNDSVP